MIRRVLITISVFLFLDCSFELAQTADIAKQLAIGLQDKVLTLRSFTKSNRLQFDIDGRLRNSGPPGSWTIFSTLQVRKVEIAQRRVRIGGPRIVYHFDRNAKKLIPSRSNQNLEIELEIIDGSAAKEISALLSKVIVGAEGLSQYVPVFWRRYLENQTASKPVPPGFADFRTDVSGWLDVANGAPTPKPLNSGGLEHPKLVTRVRPQYSEEAKQFLLEGLVVLEAQVSESGTIDNVAILLPAGAGFDENAVDAVIRWKYEPLITNGKPTPFLTTITVNYAFSH